MKNLRPRPGATGWIRPIISTPGRRFATVLLLLGLPAISLGVGGANGSAVLQSVLTDPLSVFAGRSPGERGVGILAQTKMPLTPGPPSPVEFRELVPSAGFLPDVTGTLPPSAFGPQPGTGFGPALFTSLFDDAGPTGLGPSGGLPPLPFMPGDDLEGANLAPPGGSPGVPPGPGLPNLPPELPAVPSVPEPGMWLTMLVGFFSVGWAMRSLRRKDRSLARIGSAGTLPDIQR